MSINGKIKILKGWVAKLMEPVSMFSDETDG